MTWVISGAGLDIFDFLVEGIFQGGPDQPVI